MNEHPTTQYHRAGTVGRYGRLFHEYLRYCRCMRVPRKGGGVLSGPPFTLVVAEKWFEQDRLIFFVDLRSRLWIDGWTWSRMKRRYRDASIVEASTLCPFHPGYRRPALSRKDRKFFRKWRTHYRNEWIAKLKAESVCELWPANWWERLVERFTTPRISRDLQLLSESSIKWFHGHNDLYGRHWPPAHDFWYAHESTVLVSDPILYRDSLGGTKECLGYAVITPHVQADCKQFAVRCWWVDHGGDKKFFDGNNIPLNTKGVVSLLDVMAGMESPPFNPVGMRETSDRLAMYQRHLTWQTEWLKRIAKKNA